MTTYETATLDIRPGELPDGNSDFKRFLQIYNYCKKHGIEFDFEKIIQE